MVKMSGRFCRRSAKFPKCPLLLGFAIIAVALVIYPFPVSSPDDSSARAMFRNEMLHSIAVKKLSCPDESFWTSQQRDPRTAMSKDLLDAEVNCYGLASRTLVVMLEDHRPSVRMQAVEKLFDVAQRDYTTWRVVGKTLAELMNAGNFPTRWNSIAVDDLFFRELRKYGPPNDLLFAIEDNLTTINRMLFMRLLLRRAIINAFAVREWGDDVRFNPQIVSF